MSRSSSRQGRSSRWSALALSFALVGGVTAACAPPTPPPPSAQEQFCELWDDVSAAPPSLDEAVLVKSDVVAMASDTTLQGSSCTASNAKIALDGAILAEGTEVPVEQGTSSTETVAAVTGEEIGSGQPVLDNVELKVLSAQIGVNGITVTGNVAVRLSGATSTLGFVGTLSNLENWSVSLSSSGLIIPGITTSPVVFSGTLRVTNGVPSLALTAAASLVEIGDITVSGANLSFAASPTTGVSASVAGTVKVGPSTATGTVAVDFDQAGALVSAKADIAARLRGTQAGGSQIDLTGEVHLLGNAEETAVSFTGSGILGDLVVNEANGSLTLGVNRATLVGVIDVAQGPNTVRFNGSIVWDGITAFVPYLTLEGAGEYSGTLNDGTAVSVAGNVSTEIVGGQVRAVVNGNFKIGTLKATGSAVVNSNGTTTTLEVDADLVDAGFAANVQGAVVITDGVAETVQLDAVVNGAVSLGDLTLTGATLSIRSTYGSPLQLSFAGGVKVGSRANLSGALAAAFGPNGSLISLEGNLVGSLQLDTWGLANFSGSVIVSPEQVTLTGQGSISTVNFPLGINFRGTFTSSLTQPTWSLTGSGNFRIAFINVASARLSLSQTAGMKATRVGFYLSIIGIPTYLEADFFMNASGGCSKVQLTGGSFLARPIASLILPGLIGCPVYN